MVDPFETNIKININKSFNLLTELSEINDEDESENVLSDSKMNINDEEQVLSFEEQYQEMIKN